MTSYNDTMKTILTWSRDQARFLNASESNLLKYFAISCFYSDENREGAPAGQVLYAYSKMDAIQMYTGWTSRATVFKVLKSLEKKGFIFCEKRSNRPAIIQLRYLDSELQQHIWELTQADPSKVRKQPRNKIQQNIDTRDCIVIQFPEKVPLVEN